MLSAGGYDVAGKRMENDLAVDGGWVQRKNPDFIVKFVAASALNSIGIELIDHIIVNEEDSYSMRTAGMLPDIWF